MKTMNQTFLQKTKRFLEPMKFRKIEYSKEIFKSLIIAFNWVVHILFLEVVVRTLESWNSWEFVLTLKIYAAYIFCFEILHFCIRKWGWMNTLPYSDSVILEKYLSKYVSMDNNKIELLWTWKLVGIIKEWTYVWVEMISDFIEKFTALLVIFLFSLYMIWKYNIYYVFIFIILFILFFFVAFWANSKLIQFRSERYEIRNERLRQFVKIMMSKIEILQTWRISWEIEKLYQNSQKITDVSRKMAFHRVIMKRVAPFIMSLIILVIFIVLWDEVINWSISLSIIVWLSGTFIIMQKSIADALSFYVQITKRFVSIEKLWNFSDTTPQITGYDEWKTFKHKSWEVSLKDVSYGYDELKLIFENFSLDIPGNQITALVWPSGGGKSTLVKLISGYIRQDGWDILVDNQNLREVSLKSYYSDVGYLNQEPSVFDWTVEENLLYAVTPPLPTSPKLGEEQATNRQKNEASLSPKGEGIQGWGQQEGEFQEKLKEIIKLAHCEFIYDLPNGLKTEIGERWVKLSWGQKQRLAIAKIFLKNPKIIILDEPTSALDSLSEQKITQAMHNLFKNRTVLMIAHRLQTVKYADDIIVIDQWKIKERGTHDELVKQKWFYKQMLDLQSGF